MYWTGIEKIQMNNNITNVPDWAFAMQMNLASVTLSKAVTSIGSSALEECAFTSIDLPEGLETIGDYAFFDSKLTALILPSTLTAIGADAFLDNEDLATITCAAINPVSCAAQAFGDGSTLSAIFVPEGSSTTYKTAPGWSNYADKIQDVPTTTFTYTATEKETDFDEFTYFKGAMGIKSHEFDEATQTGTVVYSGYVTAIGKSALTYTKLTSITIPESVTSIDTYSFQGSKQLTTVTFAGTPALKTIGVRAFSSCEALTAFTVPATVTSIGESAFSSCSELVTFTFADMPSITTIGNSAFQDCKKLTAFTIPESVTTLGTTVFWFAGLTSLHIPASVTSIGQALYCSCPLTSLTVDTTNPKYADLKCNGIFDKVSKKLVAGGAATKVPSGIVAIGQEAFWGEEGKFVLTLPESVTAIESRAFHMTRGMTSLTIPSGITNIDEECFFFCEGIEDIYCYADADAMNWGGGMAMPQFNMMNEKATKFHVKEEALAAWEAKFPDANVTFVGDLADLPDAEPGDANGDGSIDAEDIVAIINYIMGKEQGQFFEQFADANNDGAINAADIVTIVNKIAPASE
jgi:putative transposon-encoded protein